MLVFDVTDRETFSAIPAFYDEITKSASENVPIILVGNRADEEGKRAVTYQEAMV